MEKLTGVVARVLFAVPFLLFGMMHFMNGQMMKGMVPSWVPGGILWVYLTGLALVLAGIAVVTKKQGRLACLLLALLLGIFILTVHIPSMMSPETMQMGMMGALKDMGLAGGALAFARIFSEEG